MTADKIKYVRKELLHASQEEFGNMLGVSRSSINNWELGTGKPSTLHLIGISKLSGLSIDYLLNDDEIKDFISLDRLTDDQRIIIEALIAQYRMLE